ncbi:MAG: malonyl-[acyl-carrier protein] O-methyltransferase BioC [Candidatus Methylumidiphilus alinenensis]|uniref:Malonyl-[acyl-carrier protein] O-methyltransferase n=1 Tax=Candidatus Methylumidiphilus alinenensis TaxID=2202197 RepID=A0A2W4RKL4_9GAMM|nr:MAG: malonyl-[acyl-carrier protein] O-methyltransferase BioC [Candidatus Methylumidiphilus alinenensis]
MNQAAMIDKRWVGRSFSRAASGYDRVAALQRQVGEGLLDRLPAGEFMPKSILDLGAGTGYCTALLGKRFPNSSLIAVDIAEGMLSIFKQRSGLQEKALRICGDGETLPLRDGSVDMVYSNLALQWCPDLSVVMGEFFRVLRPGGVLLFSTFGEASLCELRNAWAKADNHSHVNTFASKSAIETALTKAKFGDVSVLNEQCVIAYSSVNELLCELKKLGAHNITMNRPRHLTGKGVFRKMMEAYASAMPTGRINATFEIIHGLARLPSN